MKRLETVEINPKLPPKAVVIWLHGLGANGYDFVDALPLLQLPSSLPVRFIFPHAPLKAINYFGGERTRAWFNISELKFNTLEDEEGIRESEKLIAQLIAAELNTNNTQNYKLVIAGFSQGGAMALQCGLRYPKKLAGILVLSSWLPLTHKVNIEKSTANQTTPILMLHGTNDDLVPISWAKTSCDYLNSIGYNAELISYPMQHTVCPKELATIGNWLSKILT